MSPRWGAVPIAALALSLICLLGPGSAAAAGVAAQATVEPLGLCATGDGVGDGSALPQGGSDPQPAGQLVDQAEVVALAQQYPSPGTPEARRSASDLMVQGSSLAAADRKLEAELRMRAALILDPQRSDIEAAIVALNTPAAPATDDTFRDALALLRCPDPMVAIEGLELAIAIAADKSLPLPPAVIGAYPADQRAYLEADRLLVAGREDDAHRLAQRIAGEAAGGAGPAALPDRYQRTLWDRWVDSWASTVLEDGAKLVGLLAVAGFAAWALLQLVKKLWRHRWWHREVQVALGEFSDGSQISGAVAAAKAVVTRELQFAAGQSSSLDAITGAGAAMTTVELPSQLKVLSPLLDWARRGPRYSLVVHIHRESATMLAILGEIHTTTGRAIAAESFREPIVGDNGIEAVDLLSIDLASWAAFEVSRLRRWPRIRKGLHRAPRLLGTERSSSYALYRRAMQSSPPDRKLLEQAIAISPNNFAALLELGTGQIRDAVPGRGLQVDIDELYGTSIKPGLRRLAQGLVLVDRYPTVTLWPRWWYRQRMFDLGLYAEGLAVEGRDDGGSCIGWPEPRVPAAYRLSQHPGLLLCMFAQVDPMWFHATFRLAVGQFHTAALLADAEHADCAHVDGEEIRKIIDGHLKASAKLATALAKAVGATQYSLVGQFGSRATSALAIGDYGTRRALVELTQRDGAYFASILAGILTAAEQAWPQTERREPTRKHDPVDIDGERLLERLGSSRRRLSDEQLRAEIEPYRARDYRIAYNSAVNRAQDPAIVVEREPAIEADEANEGEGAGVRSVVSPMGEVTNALDEAFRAMPMPVLRRQLGWFKKDPSLWRAWRADEAAMTEVFAAATLRVAPRAPEKQPNWVDA